MRYKVAEIHRYAFLRGRFGFARGFVWASQITKPQESVFLALEKRIRGSHFRCPGTHICMFWPQSSQIGKIELGQSSLRDDELRNLDVVSLAGNLIDLLLRKRNAQQVAILAQLRQVAVVGSAPVA